MNSDNYNETEIACSELKAEFKQEDGSNPQTLDVICEFLQRVGFL